MRGCKRQHDRHVEVGQCLDECAERTLVSRQCGPMEGREHKGCTLVCSGALPKVTQQHITRDVTGLGDDAWRSLGPETVGRGGRWSAEQMAQHIDHSPINLLGQIGLARTEARFHVDQRIAILARGQGRAQRAVRVSDDDDGRRLVRLERFRRSCEDGARLRRGGIGAHFEKVIGARNAELLVEETIQLEVVMLSGVDGDHLPSAPQHLEKYGRLDDLWTGAEAEGQQHSISDSRIG